MYFVLKSLKSIYIIPLYMFRTPLCPSSGASQLHMQSLVPINYKNTYCLQICHYAHFIIIANYLCDTYRPFFNLYVCFVLFCFWLWLCGICFFYIIVSTSSWRFYSSYHNDARNHEPEIYIVFLKRTVYVSDGHQLHKFVRGSVSK